MANQFALPCVKSITYLRGDEVKNKAVNLTLCIAIEKERFKWYPDNVGKPCIVFHFEQGSKESWVYDREEDRDRDFDRIIKVTTTQENN
jgi:hypothetical protein